MATSADGKPVFGGAASGAVVEWNLTTGARVRDLVGHRGGVNGIALSADGQRVASASSDTTLLIWEGAR